MDFEYSFQILGNAIERLKEVMHSNDSHDYIRDAAIQRFEFVIELFWKVLKKILSHEKVESTTPKDTLRKAYEYKLINDEEMWLEMLNDRNNTSNAYNEELSKIIFENIKNYLEVFEKTYTSLKNLYKL